MKFLRLFKKYRELEENYEAINVAFDEVCAVCKKLEYELDFVRKDLAEARAKPASPSPHANAAAPPPSSQKVPHCNDCKHHERFNNAGKYAHRCDKAGRMVSGNDTRTSPRWCPLRGKDG